MRQGLSDLQGRLLVGIYERHLDHCRSVRTCWPHLSDADATRQMLDVWARGVPWGSPDGATRSDHAAQSRALARLEGYSLIKRLNWTSEVNRRTTHVQMRSAGIVMAEQLTHKRGVWLLTIGTLSVPTRHVMTDEEYTQEMERIRSQYLH